MQSLAHSIEEEYDSTMSYGAEEEPLAFNPHAAGWNVTSETSSTGNTASWDVEDKSKSIFLPEKKPGKRREKELQWWIGRVSEVQQSDFTAILEDLSGRTNIVEFDKKFVSEKDKEFLFVGSKFTYSVSVLDTGSGATEYRTRMAFDSRRRWLESYEDNVERIAEEIFPANLIDL
jgi:hypothetical protein